jgi:hypothetical protein
VAQVLPLRDRKQLDLAQLDVTRWNSLDLLHQTHHLPSIMVTMRGNPADQVAYAIAEKQLYSSHYFETALDLSFCVRGNGDPTQSGFYLIMAMGSEQAGLTGVKGSIVRKAAVGRSVSSLRSSLTTIKNVLESK